MFYLSVWYLLSVVVCFSNCRYIVTLRGMASRPFNGQGSAGLAAPTSCSASFSSLVFAHGVEARPRPSEAYAELHGDGVELENSRSSPDSLAQRDVSTSEARVFGPGVGPSGPLDLTSIVSDPNRSRHTSRAAAAR